MKDAKLTECPEAGCSGSIKRLLGTGGGIIFKGSGFYQTDYRSSAYQAAAKSDAGPSAPATPPPAVSTAQAASPKSADH